MQKVGKLLPTLFSIFCFYLLGYTYARAFIFHAVESYAGAEGKGKPRQDYITKKELSPEEGWEYQFFLPAIKVEESIINYFHNK
jgi:hypothetical protein